MEITIKIPKDQQNKMAAMKASAKKLLNFENLFADGNHAYKFSPITLISESEDEIKIRLDSPIIVRRFVEYGKKKIAEFYEYDENGNFKIINAHTANTKIKA